MSINGEVEQLYPISQLYRLHRDVYIPESCPEPAPARSHTPPQGSSHEKDIQDSQASQHSSDLPQPSLQRARAQERLFDVLRTSRPSCRVGSSISGLAQLLRVRGKRSCPPRLRQGESEQQRNACFNARCTKKE
jgi:hypothetical protein